MREKDIQNAIRLGVNDIAVLFRANVGRFNTEDGRVITTGLPEGFPDLFGFRKSDGKFIFIEVKNEKGKLRPAQEKFLQSVERWDVCAGVARSVDDARRIITGIS